MIYVLVIVAVSFSVIHLLEYLSYYARVAGHLAGKPVTGYAIQNATNTITRFFYLVLMPLLGFLVDHGIETTHYIALGLIALAGAACASLLVYLLRFRCIELLYRFVAGRDQRPQARQTVQALRAALRANGHAPVSGRIAVLSCIVFTCYALGVLVAYLFALVFNDYRTTISQLSGVVNGCATVLLTFVLEPRIATIVDHHAGSDVYAAVQSLLHGRAVAVGLVAPLIFFSIGYGLV